MRKTLWTATALLAPTVAYAATDASEPAGAMALILVPTLALYFLPSMIGVGRHVNNCAALVIVNLLLGWTVILWLVCAIWAVVGKTIEEDAFYRERRKEDREKRHGHA